MRTPLETEAPLPPQPAELWPGAGACARHRVHWKRRDSQAPPSGKVRRAAWRGWPLPKVSLPRRSTVQGRWKAGSLGLSMVGGVQSWGQ